jgi:hypothetical protein
MGYGTAQWDTGSHGAVTMFSIATVRKWAERQLGATSSQLVIERDPLTGKTRVCLRFLLECDIAEAEVAALLLVKRRGGKGVHESLRGVCRFEAVA